MQILFVWKYICIQNKICDSSLYAYIQNPKQTKNSQFLSTFLFTNINFVCLCFLGVYIYCLLFFSLKVSLSLKFVYLHIKIQKPNQNKNLQFCSLHLQNPKQTFNTFVYICTQKWDPKKFLQFAKNYYSLKKKTIWKLVDGAGVKFRGCSASASVAAATNSGRAARQVGCLFQWGRCWPIAERVANNDCAPRTTVLGSAVQLARPSA